MAPLIIAHRGGAPELGENSALAFESALESGADMLEMDVQRSADGRLIVMHDTKIPRRSGQVVSTSSLTHEQLQALNPSLMLFEEFLDRFGETIPLNVDVKGAGFERELVTMLRSRDLPDGLVVSGRDALALRRIKLLAPEFRIGLSRGLVVPWLGREPHATIAAEMLRPTLPAQLPLHAGLALADRFMLNHRLINPWLVRFLRWSGYSVFCWTVNDPSRARWLADAGVDAIATDHPALIAKALSLDHEADSRVTLK